MSEGYIIGGGSSGGGTLTVTGVAGSTVTVSKDGKTRARVFDSTGKATFKGLASGTWTLIMTNGVQTATRTVEITADYSVSIAYFAATINITYPAGSTCTATDGATTLTAPDTLGTWACVVPNTGTWTISCTTGTKTSTNTVSITNDGQTASVTLIYRLYLYKQGDECAGVTGGWAGVAASFGQASGIAPTVTKGTSAITAAITAQYYSGQLIIGKSISFAGYKTLTFVVTGITVGGEDNANYYPCVGVFRQRGGNYNNTRSAYKSVSAKGTVNIDISNVASGYVGVGLYYNNTAGKSSITISDIYLE